MSKKKYNEYKKLDYAEIGRNVLDFWKKADVFERSVTERKDRKTFTFYEGPPSANGTPGIHHVMARTVKDIFCRFKTMKNLRVQRKGGWDTHGLPVELQVEKELGITKEDIGKKISVEDYNKRCREAVMKYKGEWEDLTEKMGYWVDTKDPYITFENNYIESVWNILNQLHEKKYLYKGYSIQPYSPAAGTGLSSHELNQPGTYRNVKDTSVTAQFEIKGEENTYLLAWTTTPWTLPANSALAVGENIDYVKVATVNQYSKLQVNVILAKDRLEHYFNDKDVPYSIIESFKGQKLIGKKYKQLLPYVQLMPMFERIEFQVVADSFVNTDEGTGIVHIAPTFGADDRRIAGEHNIQSILVQDELGAYVPIVDKQGRYVQEITDFAGRFVRSEYESEEILNNPDYHSVDIEIAIKLKKENKAFKVEKYEHSYPHCWRTDKPILYYPLDSWFVKTTAVKDKLVELNRTIKWKPESTGSGRFGNWLENLVDWNLSRSRFWGTPLPIWETKESAVLKKEFCVGSVSELKEKELDLSDDKSFKLTGWYFGGEKFESFKKEFKAHAADNFHDKTFPNKLEEIEGKNSQHDVRLQNLAKSDFLPHDFANSNIPVSFFKEYLISVSECAEAVKDLHRPYVDRIAFIGLFGEAQLGVVEGNSEGKRKNYNREILYTRVPDLIDVWFDSGSMPYAQWHYPFENEETFEKNFPADFIAEGVDQTRGWFFTLHTIAVLLNEINDEVKAINKRNGNEGVAFKNVISNGLVLDKNGNKMSKRLGNTVNPFETIEKYGADATRWYLIENAPPWENLKFDINGITEAQRRFFGTLHNTYNFFALYANIDGFTYEEDRIPFSQRNESDRWILSLLNGLIKEADDALENYEPTRAVRAVQDFVCDALSNWYVRLNRKRFWKNEYNPDKTAAYQTLYECLDVIAKLIAPVSPFYADFLYKNLNSVSEKFDFKSVHLEYFPVSNPEERDPALEQRIQLARITSSLVHSLRKKARIKVRQPLAKILIPVLDKDKKKQYEAVEEMILAEVNVKSIEYADDSSAVLVKKIKPDFTKLGRRYGPKMKGITTAVTAASNEDIAKLEQEGTITFDIENEKITLTLDELIISSDDIPGRLSATESGITVALDITLTDELKQEGIARDLVNRIQNIRKDMGLEVTDKINLTIEKNTEEVNTALKNFENYIRLETQALNLAVKDKVEEGESVEIDELTIKVKAEAL